MSFENLMRAFESGALRPKGGMEAYYEGHGNGYNTAYLLSLKSLFCFAEIEIATVDSHTAIGIYHTQ